MSVPFIPGERSGPETLEETDTIYPLNSVLTSSSFTALDRLSNDSQHRVTQTVHNPTLIPTQTPN